MRMARVLFLGNVQSNVVEAPCWLTAARAAVKNFSLGSGRTWRAYWDPRDTKASLAERSERIGSSLTAGALSGMVQPSSTVSSRSLP